MTTESKKRFQEVVVYEGHIYKHVLIDNKKGTRERLYDMENEETDRLQREKNIENEKECPELFPDDGDMEILREWD